MFPPVVFLDISINNHPAERLLIQLYDKPAKTVENFRALCAGDTGRLTATGKRLHYKGCEFYLVFQGIAIEAGDFENQDGTGGESIYGGTFLEYNSSRGSGRGVIMMKDQGCGEIGSRFYICLRKYFPMDRMNVAVGSVIGGWEYLNEFDHLFLSGLKPFARIQITDCGEITDKPTLGSIFSSEATQIRKEEAVAKLLKENDSKKYESSSYEKPSSSNPHQHDSDNLSKSRNGSKKSESPAFESTLIHLKQSLEKLDFQIRKLAEDKKKKSKADWPVIAVSAVATGLVGVFISKRM